MKLKRLVSSICILSILLMSNIVLANQTYIPMVENSHQNSIAPRMNITDIPVIENGKIGYFVNQSTGKPFTFLQGSALYINLSFNGPTNCRYGIVNENNTVYKNIQTNNFGMPTMLVNYGRPDKSYFDPSINSSKGTVIPPMIENDETLPSYGYIVSPANCIGKSFTSCTFAIPATGKYKIFIQNLGTDPISIKNFEVGDSVLGKVPSFKVLEERTLIYSNLNSNSMIGGLSFGRRFDILSEIQNGQLKINDSYYGTGYIDTSNLIDRKYR